MAFLFLQGCETTRSFNPKKAASENLIAPKVEIPVLVIDRWRFYRDREYSPKEAPLAVLGKVFPNPISAALMNGEGRIFKSSQDSALKHQLSARRRGGWQGGVEPVLVDILLEEDLAAGPVSVYPHEMDTNRIKAAAREFDADLIIVTEKLEVESRYATSKSRHVTSAIHVNCDVRCQLSLLIRLYEGRTGKLLDEVVVTDLLTMTDEVDEEKDYQEKCSKEQNTLTHKAIAAVVAKFSDYFEPFLVVAGERYYSDVEGLDFKLLRDAIALAGLGDWQGAEAIWEASVEKAVIPTTKADLLYNLALAAQKRGDEAMALGLAEKSYLLNINPIVGDYIAWLSQR